MRKCRLKKVKSKFRKRAKNDFTTAFSLVDFLRKSPLMGLFLT